MTDSTKDAPFALSDVDFNAMYEGKPALAGTDLTFGKPPWDIGGPQPVVTELADADGLTSEVLDAGCGAGDNACYLAGHGYRVTGVDGSTEALRIAGERATEAGVSVTFVHADVTTFDGVEDGRFSSVLDSALYHCLDDDQQHRYAAALHRVTRPGARLHLFCFADQSDDGFRMPNPISRANLREHLTAHWEIEEIERERYVTALTPDAVRAGAETLANYGFTVDPERLATDDEGRIVGSMWHLSAVRR